MNLWNTINTILVCIGIVLIITNRFVDIPFIGRIGDYLVLLALILYPITKGSKNVVNKKQKVEADSQKTKDGSGDS